MIEARRSPELEELAREGRRRFEAGDEAWFERMTAQGAVASFGTAADEQSRGRDEVLALTTEQIREMSEAAGLDVVAPEGGGDLGEIEAYEAGDTGWIVTHDRFTFEDGTWAAMRVVNVLARDPASREWRFVLTTSQILVPNELLGEGSPLRLPAQR